MSSLVRPARHATGLMVLLAIAACSSNPRGGPPEPKLQPLTETERVAHVLARLTFGARPGDAGRVAAMGVDRWLDDQLKPETIVDTAVLATLAKLPPWNGPATAAFKVGDLPKPIANLSVAQQSKDSVALAAITVLKAKVIAATQGNDLFYAGRIISAQQSERQLLEVVTGFWENHFSVFTGKMPSREALVAWDREVLRPHALGRFRDLLDATAHSPAMLFYLDNHLSTRRGLNENYARELLELHTMGVDGGYTQKDVQEVARALTGWTIRRTPDSSTFLFRKEQHDTGAKSVLGHTLPAGRGIEDGEEVLDIIARHPSTAHYISLKLVRRLVADDPPPALVDRAAATFLKTDGDIREVVRTIVTSREFFSRAAFRAKVKTPYELVVSAWRALGVRGDTTPSTARLISQLGQASFGWQPPDGWPEKGAAWMNSGTMFKRVKFGRDLAGGSFAYSRPDRGPLWAALATLPFDEQVSGVVREVLGGVADSTTLRVMASVRGENASPPAKESQQHLRDLLAIAFASPEFQRR